MARRTRQKPGLHQFIIPLVFIFYGLAQIFPNSTLLFTSAMQLLFLMGLAVGTLLLLGKILNGKPTGTGWDQNNPVPKKRPNPVTQTRVSHPAIKPAVTPLCTPTQPTPPEKSSQARISHPAIEPVVTPFFTPTQPTPPEKRWSLELLQELEWKRFEQLCEAYFKVRNMDAKTTQTGSDGGVDIRLYHRKSGELFALMQCKAWKGRVGVRPVRELYGVMASEGIERGIFLCSGDYTPEARRFCDGKKLRLISGKNLLTAILKLNGPEQLRLLELATRGDYRTPTCPNCDIKLVKRHGNREPFWGCNNFPRCRYTMQMRRDYGSV